MLFAGSGFRHCCMISAMVACGELWLGARSDASTLLSPWSVGLGSVYIFCAVEETNGHPQVRGAPGLQIPTSSSVPLLLNAGRILPCACPVYWYGKVHLGPVLAVNFDIATCWRVGRRVSQIGWLVPVLPAGLVHPAERIRDTSCYLINGES